MQLYIKIRVIRNILPTVCSLIGAGVPFLFDSARMNVGLFLIGAIVGFISGAVCWILIRHFLANRFSSSHSPCISCGYLLSIANSPNNCPECGERIDIPAFQKAWLELFN